jgi:quercetin dioxygenase-like cupin family protein
MLFSNLLVNPFESKSIDEIDGSATISHGNTQSFTTNICQLSIHRLPKGASIPKESHHLARWILTIKGTVNVKTGVNQELQELSADQSILLHAYTRCEVRNASIEEAWVVELAFMTVDPLQSPAVRRMTGRAKDEFCTSCKQFALPDWSIQWTKLTPEQELVFDLSEQLGHVMVIDQENADDTHFFRMNGKPSIAGGLNGKHIFFICENKELWN